MMRLHVLATAIPLLALGSSCNLKATPCATPSPAGTSTGSAGSGAMTGSGAGSTGAGAAPCQVTSEHALFVASNGDDGAAGTEAAPFSTIQHAVDVATPGDTVFVRAGVYAELVTFHVSGTPGAPITLRPYCGEIAVLDGKGIRKAGTPALISITDQHDLVIDGLELRGLAGADRNFPAGIWVRGASRDILLQRNHVHGITAEGGGKLGGAHGIAVYGTSTTPIEGVRVAGNTVHDLVLGASEAVVINGNVRHFEVTDNVVHDVDNIAFDFIGFEPDVCTACSQADVVEVEDVNRVRHGVVRGNTAYAMTTAQNPAYTEKSAACFYVDGGASIVIEQNTAHHCDLGVELASEHHKKATRDVIVRGNFLFDHDVAGIAMGGYDAGTGPGGGSAENCFIVGNTIVDSSKSGWAKAAILLQNRNVSSTIVGNIIVATSGHRTVADEGSLNTGTVLDHNLYWGGDLASVSGGIHSITADPKLVAPATGDLHLTPGSPAIGAGSDLGAAIVGAFDIDGEARVQGAIDIGADER